MAHFLFSLGLCLAVSIACLDGRQQQLVRPSSTNVHNALTGVPVRAAGMLLGLHQALAVPVPGALAAPLTTTKSKTKTKTRSKSKTKTKTRTKTRTPTTRTRTSSKSKTRSRTSTAAPPTQSALSTLYSFRGPGVFSGTNIGTITKARSNGTLFANYYASDWGSIARLNPTDLSPVDVYIFDPRSKYENGKAVGINSPCWKGIMQDSNTGVFYGIAMAQGHELVGKAMLFSMDANGKVSSLYPVDNVEYSCSAPLIQAADNNLYTVSENSDVGKGMIVKCSLTNNAVSAAGCSYLKVFTDANTRGSNPYGPIVQGGDGYLYGTTQRGGLYGRGVVYKVKTDGTGFTALHHFTSSEFPSSASPKGLWQRTGDSRFYGIVNDIYANSGITGGIYRITSDGTMTILSIFNQTMNQGIPVAPLVDGQDGFIYGATSKGGPDKFGTIFKMDPESGARTVLASFKGTNGAVPSNLVRSHDGTKLFGSTIDGGLNLGVAFQVTLSNNALKATLNDASNGFNPAGRLLQGLDGKFYGTTPLRGAGLSGTLFRVSTTGQFETLVNFGVDGNTAAAPTGVLVQDTTDGWIYGSTTTTIRPLVDGGTLFRFHPDTKTFQLLATFDGQIATVSDGPIAISASGYVYVLATVPTTVWKVSKSGGTPTKVAQLDGYASSGLYLGADGYSIYGTTQQGGVSGRVKTFYKISTLDDTITTIAELPASIPDSVGSQGIALTLAKDGSFYGFSRTGGASNTGLAFRLTTLGDFTLIYSFNSTFTTPTGAPAIGADGALYGVAESGNPYASVPAAFKINPTHGSIRTLAKFNPAVHGSAASGGLIVGSNKLFYGTTSGGGVRGGGTVFRLES